MKAGPSDSRGCVSALYGADQSPTRVQNRKRTSKVAVSNGLHGKVMLEGPGKPPNVSIKRLPRARIKLASRTSAKQEEDDEMCQQNHSLNWVLHFTTILL